MTNRTLSLCVAEFQGTTGERDRAASTRQRRALVLGRLLDIAGPGLQVSKLTRRHFDATLNTFRDSIKDSSMNAYKTDLRKFARWLHVEEYSKFDLAAHIINKKSSTPAYKKFPITALQAEELLTHTASIHPRDGITAHLMLSTGMRASEVVGLEWGTVDFRNAIAETYRPKTLDWHNAYLTTELMEDLEKWRSYYEQRHGRIQPTWYVVPALAHKCEGPGFYRMDPTWPMVPTKKQNSIGSRVKGWLAAVGETDLRGRAAHTLRRTAGDLLLEVEGVDIRDVQEFFGHKSVGQTEQYLNKRVAQERLRHKIPAYRLRRTATNE
jgi:integrase